MPCFATMFCSTSILMLSSYGIYVTLQKEVDSLTKSLHSLQKQPVFAKKFIIPSLSNVISVMLFGIRYPREHKRTEALYKIFSQVNVSLTAGSLVAFLPFWMYIIGSFLPFLRLYYIRTTFNELLRYIR